MRHTPGPWAIESDTWLIWGECHDGELGVPILRADTDHRTWGREVAHEERDANVERVVACVNACEGIPTEALDAGVVRELVEALEVLVGEIEWEIGEEKWGRDPDALPMARAVLAKVRGEGDD